MLLPPMCILCGYLTKLSQSICQACQQELPILAQHCHQCAHFLTGSLMKQPLCGTCLTSPPPFDKTHTLFPYRDPIIQLIIKLKFRGALSHAQTLGQFMAKKISHEWYLNEALPNIILPVPLHAKRLRERGFNQALEIARPVSAQLNIPIDIKGIKRIRHTAAQSGLTAKERKQNIKNAFEVGGHYAGLHIAVIDDVVTTGQTLRELCHLLKEAGARRIDIWCCARR